jgi:hypothetical protein
MYQIYKITLLIIYSDTAFQTLIYVLRVAGHALTESRVCKLDFIINCCRYNVDEISKYMHCGPKP